MVTQSTTEQKGFRWQKRQNLRKTPSLRSEDTENL
jgi:hypothetical protein